MIADPVKGYAQLAAGVVVAVVVLVLGALLFMGGVYVGKGQATRTVIAKNEALSNASASLRGAAAALRTVDRESKRRIEEAKGQQAQAEQAAQAAARGEQLAKRKADQLERDLDQARRNASCKALLRRDLRQECGL